MKYFSPSILDGSVITAKLADGAVTHAKVSLGTATQSGSIGIQGKVAVLLDQGAILPDIEGDMPASSTLDMQQLARFVAIPSANANLPQFDLRNEDTGSARSYSVAWRFIDV